MTGTRRTDHAITWSLRALACGSVAVAIAPKASATADSAVAALWSLIFSCSFAHNCMFEGIVAIASFAVWIWVYNILDSTSLAPRYRFDRASPQRLRDGHSNRGVLEATVYLLSIAAWHVFVRTRPPLEESAPTFSRLLYETLSGLIAYDLLFFPIHLALHHFAWVRSTHGDHHATGGALRASETTHHSLVDGMLQVAVNVVVQQRAWHPWSGRWGRKHDLSRLLHNVAVTYMLTECHSGYDAPWCMHRVAPAVLGGGLRHREHHHHGTVCFAQFSLYLDWLCGTSPSAALTKGAVCRSRASQSR